MPNKQYLGSICNLDFRDLHAYNEKYSCGKPMLLQISGKIINVIPIAHLRQIGGLGDSSHFWADIHSKWENEVS
jgi:hypothetical protein